MKKIINVAHLYYDLMNLYGENGNMLAIERFIKRQGVDCKIDRLSIEDKIDFSKYDLFYMGSGIEESQMLVLEDLIKYKEDIKKSIEDDKFFIITGNAMELFGKKIRLREDVSIDALDIFNYNSIGTSTRIVSELSYEFDELDEDKGRKIIGFKNCNSNIVNNDGERIFKFSDNIRYKNFYGMMFFGPILIRNPYFTDYILSKLFNSKDLEYKMSDDTIEYQAYTKYLENFIINDNLD